MMSIIKKNMWVKSQPFSPVAHAVPNNQSSPPGGQPPSFLEAFITRLQSSAVTPVDLIFLFGTLSGYVIYILNVTVCSLA